MSSTALITGASGGLGYAIAELFAKRSYDLVLVSRNKKKLSAIADEFSAKYNVTVSIIPADLSLPNAPKAVFDACRKKKISIDVLVNNAGVGTAGEHLLQADTDVDGMIRLNVNALTALTLLFAREMKKRKSGMIMNVASLVSALSVPYFTVYAATKSFVVSYSRSIRSEFKPYGISVTCLLPGFITTGFEKSAGIRSASYSKMVASLGMSAEAVASIGVRAMIAHRGFVVAGFMNKIGLAVIRILPKQLLANTAYGMMKQYFR